MSRRRSTHRQSQQAAALASSPAQSIPRDSDVAANIRRQLSDEDKLRIRAEEIYREEVHAELRPPTPSPPWDVWRFLNSSICIWALSSIVVSLTVWGYGKYEAGKSKASEKSEQSRRISLELQWRWEQARRELPNRNKFVLTMDGELGTEVFPELKPRSLISLLIELESLVDPEVQKKRIKDVLEGWPPDKSDEQKVQKKFETLDGFISSIQPK